MQVQLEYIPKLTDVEDIKSDLLNKYRAWDYSTTVSSIEVLKFDNSGNVTVSLIPYYNASPIVNLNFYTETTAVNIDLTEFKTFTMPRRAALVYNIETKTVSIVEVGTKKDKNNVVLLALQPESYLHDFVFTGILSNKVVKHRFLTLSNNDITITKGASRTSIITFNKACTIKVYRNIANSVYANVTAGTSYTLGIDEILALNVDARSLVVMPIGEKESIESSYIELLCQGPYQVLTGPLLESLIATNTSDIKEIKEKDLLNEKNEVKNLVIEDIINFYNK